MFNRQAVLVVKFAAKLQTFNHVDIGLVESTSPTFTHVGLGILQGLAHALNLKEKADGGLHIVRGKL